MKEEKKSLSQFVGEIDEQLLKTGYAPLKPGHAVTLDMGGCVIIAKPSDEEGKSQKFRLRDADGVSFTWDQPQVKEATLLAAIAAAKKIKVIPAAVEVGSGKSKRKILGVIPVSPLKEKE